MKKRFFLTAKTAAFVPKLAALFAIFFMQSLFFAEQIIPEEISSTINVIYETAKSDDGRWLFVSATSEKDGKNRFYSYNKKTKQTEILFEPFCDTELRFIYGMIFFEKTQKLYFMVHCGEYSANGTGNLFLYESLYTSQKDADGNFNVHGVWRQNALATWILNNLWKAYIKSPPQKKSHIHTRTNQPDYESFLKSLYSFADSDSNPIFAFQKDDGEFLYEKEALEYIIQTDKADLFLSQIEDNLYFPLEKYLFARDKNGNVLQKSAVTTRKRNPLNLENGGAVWSETVFAEANKSLYFTFMQDSLKDKGLSTEHWSWDYSLIYEISDDENGITIFRTNALKEILEEIFPFGKGDAIPIEGTKQWLLIRGSDKTQEWLYDGKKIFPYKMHNSEKSFLFSVSAFLPFFILILLFLFYEFLRGRFSLIWQRKIVYKIQEDEKNKISRDIHDTIVQDIRAIQIKAEMLEVNGSDEHKKEELIDEITDCIVKMRNICYGVTPAEFSISSLTSGKVDFLSILDSLAEQFKINARIKCTLNNEENLEEILLEKEKCQNLVRIVQESLSNIEKHSYATEAQILVRKEILQGKNILILFIIDDGRGCDLKKTMKNSKTHFGLRQMKERAETIEAEISFRSAPDDGMQIKIRLEI